MSTSKQIKLSKSNVCIDMYKFGVTIRELGNEIVAYDWDELRKVERDTYNCESVRVRIITKTGDTRYWDLGTIKDARIMYSSVRKGLMSWMENRGKHDRK